ncbi:MAG: AMP-binding protein [Clostridiales Family XIII bacterium]|jgi:long-subunit acyl-CoA synthetase (AMP-forming)|nr:AMP-binding protein [Clostridiales Family XIII bacterium]
MSYKEMIPAEEYAKIVARDEAWAQGIHDYLQNMAGKDKFMKFMNIRPQATIKRMFEDSAALYGDRPAFHEKPTHKEPYQVYTYNDALARFNQIGTALHARGLRGARISVIGDNSYAWATAYLAVVCGTGVVVPLDKELTKDEIEQLLVTADVEAVFYSKKFAKMFEEIRKGGKTKLTLFVRNDAAPGDIKGYEVSADTLIEEGKKLLAAGNRDFLDAQIDAEALGILLFTSGTTGFAKGVMLSHKNICTELMIPTTVIGIVPTDIFFSVLPLHHTYESTCGFLIPLAQGASIAYCEGLRYILDNIAEAKPTVFLAVPLLFENFYSKIWQNARKSGKEKLLKAVLKANRVTSKIGIDLGKPFFKQIRELFGGRMRIFIAGGAAINPEIIEGFNAFGIDMIQGYGLTECSPICALNPVRGGKSEGAGYLIPGFDAQISDPDPETGIGEICVKGDFVMMGYYQNQEATDEVMEDGWFHTGDYGYVDPERFVHITGRKKSVIITKNGKNVFPEELEYLLGIAPVFAELMVFELPSELNNDTIIAVCALPNADEVEGRLGKGATDDAIGKLMWAEVDKVNAGLPIFKKIRKVYLRKEPFDATTSKKIKRFVEGNKQGIEV